MASFLHRAMVTLGLVDDDDYDDYQVYPDPAGPVGPPAARSRATEPAYDMAVAPVRTLARDRDHDNGGVTVHPRPVASVVKTMPANPKVHVVLPQEFNDAKEIGEKLKTGQPVIVNLQEVDPELSRRLIDFCSGATFVLDAKMKRVAKQVFLLTPANVEVSDEEKRRLQERGLYAASN